MTVRHPTVVLASLRAYNLCTNWNDWCVTIFEEDGFVLGAGVSETIRLTDSDFRSLLANPRGCSVATNAAAMDLVE